MRKKKKIVSASDVGKCSLDKASVPCHFEDAEADRTSHNLTVNNQSHCCWLIVEGCDSLDL